MNTISVRAVIARWFPGSVITISRPGSGVSTPVFRVRIDDGIFWARLGEVPGERRDGEVAAHRLMAGLGLPVPGVVRYEAAPPELDRSITLTTHIPGVPVSTLPASPWLNDVAVQIGRVLARINGIEVSGFGWAYASEHNGAPRGLYTSRDGWVREYREALRTLDARDALPPDAMRSTAVALETWASEPSGATASLAHGDFDASHLYVDPDKKVFTGIIDFGELRGAGPLYDLGHLLLHDGEDGRPHLLESVLRGYRGVCHLPDDALARIHREAIAIGARALAIQLERPSSPYRDWLTERLVTLAASGQEDGVA